MTFELYLDIPTNKGDQIWIERGVYPVVRMLDGKRLILDLGLNVSGNRQLTIVSRFKGKLHMSN